MSDDENALHNASPEELRELRDTILARIEGLSELSIEHPQGPEASERIAKWFRVLTEIEAALNDYENNA